MGLFIDWLGENGGSIFQTSDFWPLIKGVLLLNEQELKYF